jgi:serine phosphatase RsbU (regulator of sigma subunit)/HAMP domain-containing protein
MQIKIPSFKYKMVIFSFILIGTCLGIFLYYIINYFQTDKRAYLFEEAFRFGLEAHNSLEKSASFGILLAASIKNQDDITFKSLQESMIAARIDFKNKKKSPPWSYNKTSIKELKLPESDFLGESSQQESIEFLPSPDFKSGYFKINHQSDLSSSVIAIYPKDFFELLNTKKIAKVALFDEKSKSVIFKSPQFPSNIDPKEFIHRDNQAKTFDKKTQSFNYFVTSHYSNLTQTSMIILYNMDEANQTLALLSKTLIWAAIGMFGFGILLSTFFSNSLAKPLELLAEMARKVSQGDLTVRVAFDSTDETGILAKSFNNMMDKIVMFIEDLKGKARLESELKLASLVQRNFFDLTPINKKSFDLQGDYISASECAGDWWTVREWAGKQVFFLGDATGHGAPSALLTSAVFSAVECIQNEIIRSEDWWEKPSIILEKLNHVVSTISNNIMMTFIVVIYDQESKKAWISNASHEAPILIHKNNAPKVISDIKYILCEPGPRLGDLKDPIFFNHEIQLFSDDRLVFYTDGLVEVLVEPGKKFSERYLLKRIIKIGDLALDEAIQKLISPEEKLAANDDISFFIIDIK